MRFDLDTQRGLVCLFGLVALVCEGIAFYFTGKTLPDIFTGGFIMMAMGPLGSAWVEEFSRARQQLKHTLSDLEPAPQEASHGEPSSGEQKG